MTDYVVVDDAPEFWAQPVTYEEIEEIAKHVRALSASSSPYPGWAVLEQHSGVTYIGRRLGPNLWVRHILA